METYYPPGTGKFMIALEIVHQLSNLSARAEADGRLVQEQLDIIYDQRWFKLFVPRCYGGLELTAPEGIRLEEELAWIDGSLGWTVTLCAGANLFVGYMQQPTAQTLFTDRTVCLGGSGHASGIAVAERNGYRVSGKWRYATGAPHLTHFTANCVLERDGAVVLDEAGNPQIKSFFFAKDDVRIVEDWPAFGLKATASHSFEVSGLWVDETHAFAIAPEQVTLNQLIYQYPFLQFAEATLAANTLGMSRHFVSCAKDVLKDPVVDLAKEVTERLANASASFYQAVDVSWDELKEKGQPSSRTLQTVSDRSRALVRLCHEQIMLLYPHTGLTGADASTEINRIWRDLFTASQHSLLR